MSLTKIGNCTKCGKEIKYEDSYYHDIIKDGAYICGSCGDALIETERIENDQEEEMSNKDIWNALTNTIEEMEKREKEDLDYVMTESESTCVEVLRLLCDNLDKEMKKGNSAKEL